MEAPLPSTESAKDLRPTAANTIAHVAAASQQRIAATSGCYLNGHSPGAVTRLQWPKSILKIRRSRGPCAGASTATYGMREPCPTFSAGARPASRPCATSIQPSAAFTPISGHAATPRLQ